jgi:hypothetical protein
MKAISLIPIFLIWFTAQRAEAQTYMWYHAFGGIDFDQPNHLSLDHLGNTYITGTFNSPIFNAGPLSVTGGALNFFVLKLDPVGDPVLLRKGHTAGIMSKRIYADSKENFYLIATYLGQPFLIQNQPLP